MDDTEITAKYLNIDAPEGRRLRALAERELQNIAPVLVPEGGYAGWSNHFGWPVAASAAGALVVAFSIKGGTKSELHRARPAILRSEDGGASWSAPVFPVPEHETDLVRGPGMRALGTARDGTLFLSVTQGLFRSGDAGRTWERVKARGLPVTAASGGATANAGARILDHPALGLVLAVHRHRKTDDGKTLLCELYVSGDCGLTWEALEVGGGSAGFAPAEPTLFDYPPDRLGLFCRNHAAPGTGPERYFRDWCVYSHFFPIATAAGAPAFQGRLTNIFTRRMDTPDAAYNPVSGRIEAVVSKRNEGFPYADDGCQTLTLWSMAPEEFEGGCSDWRFECVLLRSRGMMSGSEDPAFPKREGLHPAGGVIDAERGVQHILIFGGDNPHIAKKSDDGKTGVFRLTRTLDTAALVAGAGSADPLSVAGDFEADFARPEDWESCGAPPGFIWHDKNRVVPRVVPASAGTVAFGPDGLRLKPAGGEYAGVRSQRALIAGDYDLSLEFRVARPAEAGVTLGLAVHQGPRRLRVAWSAEGLSVADAVDGAFTPLAACPQDEAWHRLSIRVRKGKSGMLLDGRRLAETPLAIDARFGIEEGALVLWSHPAENGAAEVMIRRLRVENVEA